MTSKGPSTSGSNGLLGRLSRATLNYGLGQMLPQVVGFALIPVYTTYLTPEDFGVLDIATTLIAFLVIVMRMGVPGAVTRFYYDHREGEALGDYITTVTWFVMVASLGVGGLALAVGPLVSSTLLKGLDYFPFVVLAVIGAVMTGNSDIQRRLIQAREQSGYSVKLTLATAANTIAMALVFVVALGWGAWGMLLASTLTSILFFIQAIYYLRPELGGRFRRDMLRSSLTYAVAILPSHVVGTLAPLITRAILGATGTLSAVGMLSIANRFASPLGIIATALNTAYLPVYFSVRREASLEGARALAEASRNVVTLAGIFCLAVAVLGPPAILVMTPIHYHEAAPLVPIFSIGFLAQVSYTVFGAEIFYAKRTWLVPAMAGLSALVTVVVTIFTAARWGALGVAWAMNSGTAVAGVSAVVFSARLVRLPHDWWGMARNLTLMLLAYAAYLSLPIDDPWLLMAGAFTTLALVLVILWRLGDPALREGIARLKRRMGGKR